jgi:DNA-binding GntR family transcriptional regulator
MVTVAAAYGITQEEIAEQMDVSRSPVLQALRLLKKDGLVQDAAGRGVLVAELDPQWIGNLYQVRGALDTLAARLAAERKAVIDPSIIEAGRKTARGKDVKAMIEADIAFHTAIYRASGNPLIFETTQMHWVHLRRVMGAVLQSAERESIWDEHEEMARAIAAGDVARAVEMSEQHATEARKNLVARLNEVLNHHAA